ncbi:NapC/NirT cytochrome c domain protein [Shewanella halifaxensis HAW-EB4]|uniref:Cytochrome c-type protein n=1 Tax=Shewanella halifaxensis (strain HAW-EB4) TaxID=458817 RepID=B0TJ70_SHEHH|nr:NapC/NirT family cytochrome c [Shewanella halifaxensis]ABZ75661.1 NapC/NirT cytochrome c domain protein [Shewanella halifaxensis HAW-EB4]
MNNKGERTRWQRLWSWLKRPLALGIPIGVFLMVMGAASFQGMMVASNQNAFCFSCHLKMDTIVQEYKASSHYGDGETIPATCSDCHVPHPFVDKMIVKTIALKDVYHMMVGTITEENFEEHRPAMAENVWKDFKKNDSANCRECHQGENFDLAKQPQRARLNHEKIAARGETCIDCHQGLTHKRIVIR